MENRLKSEFDDKEIEKVVLRKLMYMNGAVLGLTFGLIAGFGLFIITNFLLLKGGENVGQHLSLLGHFFLGYQITFLGSLIGFLYGFVFGFVIGFVFAHLYNWLAKLREYRRLGVE